jgi:hypothetical protein
MTYSKFHSQSPAVTYWSAKHLMITSCPKWMTIMIGYERVVSPVTIFPSMIKTHHRLLHNAVVWHFILHGPQWIKTLISTRQKCTTGHRHGIFTNSILPTRCCCTIVQKFTNKIPGSRNGSDEPSGWPPRCPDIIPLNFSCEVNVKDTTFTTVFAQQLP